MKPGGMDSPRWIEAVFVECGFCGWHCTRDSSREAKAAALTHAARHPGIRVDEHGTWIAARE